MIWRRWQSSARQYSMLLLRLSMNWSSSPTLPPNPRLSPGKVLISTWQLYIMLKNIKTGAYIMLNHSPNLLQTLLLANLIELHGWNWKGESRLYPLEPSPLGRFVSASVNVQMRKDPIIFYLTVFFQIQTRKRMPKMNSTNLSFRSFCSWKRKLRLAENFILPRANRGVSCLVFYSSCCPVVDYNHQLDYCGLIQVVVYNP